MPSSLAVLSLEGMILAMLGLGVSLWLWRNVRREKRVLEDHLVRRYSHALRSTEEMLDKQEGALSRIRGNFQKLGANTVPGSEEKLSQIDRELSHNRGQLASVEHDADIPRINWSAIDQAQAECENHWALMAEGFVDLATKPLEQINELVALEEKRQSGLSSTHSRVQQLEKRIEILFSSLARPQAPQKAVEVEAAVTQAVDDLRQKWDKFTAEVEEQDNTFVKGLSMINMQMEGLEVVNQCLDALSSKLAQRHQGLLSRIAELESMAEMTPRLQEELAKLKEENTGLQSELQEFERSRNDIEKQLEALRATIAELESLPSCSKTIEANIAQDRQVIQLLREQNQRLILELEESREEAGDHDAKPVVGNAAEIDELERQNIHLSSENHHLASKAVNLRRAIQEKDGVLRALNEEIQRLKGGSPSASQGDS
jgi:uncharacterized phage infection (PIP) family protein YhgE